MQNRKFVLELIPCRCLGPDGQVMDASPDLSEMQSKVIVYELVAIQNESGRAIG